MSLIGTLKVENQRLEKGEVALIDDIAYEVIGVEKLYHYVVYTKANLPVGAQDVAMNVLNLRPEQNELYEIDNLGIDGAAIIRIEYPSGAGRNTPHNIAEYYDQVNCPKAGYAFGLGRVYMWMVPDRYPTLRLTNQQLIAIDTVVYFHGWKYRVRVITASEVEAKRAVGIRVLEAESYYPTN
jgi:hypothetical protein